LASLTLALANFKKKILASSAASLVLQWKKMYYLSYSTAVPARGGQHGELARQSAEFMKIARSIGRDITNTYSKLEKLTLLAKRKTIFDDRPEEIEELTHIIKEDMNALNRQIGQL
jgi:hypothetical protein